MKKFFKWMISGLDEMPWLLPVSISIAAAVHSAIILLLIIK